MSLSQMCNLTPIQRGHLRDLHFLRPWDALCQCSEWHCEFRLLKLQRWSVQHNNIPSGLDANEDVLSVTRGDIKLFVRIKNN
jgi:hypothetical protein